MILVTYIRWYMRSTAQNIEQVHHSAAAAREMYVSLLDSRSFRAEIDI
jgi:hypothetical protein